MSKSNKMIVKIVIICASILVLSVLVLFALVIVLGTVGPDTFVYTGRQIPMKYITTLRSLNLIQKDEQIRYFYSDAFLDITDGLYFVTDQNLVLYSTEWSPPDIIIPFDQIVSLDVEYNDSLFEDSYVYVTTSADLDLAFPVSSEKGLDKKFVEAIKEKLKVNQSTLGE